MYNGCYNEIPNDTIVSWIKVVAKDKFEDLINEEITEIGEITPQTWKIASYNVLKKLKNSPEVNAFVQHLITCIKKRGDSSDMLSLRNEFRYFSISEKHLNYFDDTGTQILGQKEFNRLCKLVSPNISPEIRMNSFRSLLTAQFPESITNEGWPTLRRNLQHSLNEDNAEIFSLCLKVHAKIISSPSLGFVKESYINLVKGLRSYYTRKSLNAIPTFAEGINFRHVTHQRLVKLTHFIVEVSKEVSKTWLRFRTRWIEEIVNAFLILVTMHMHDNAQSENAVYPFYLIAALDPKATVFFCWLHGSLGRNVLFTMQTKLVIFLRFVTETILSYLKLPADISSDKFESNLTHQLIKHISFVHCLKVFGMITRYKKVQAFFPIALKGKTEAVSLENILISLIKSLGNFHNDHSINNIITDTVINILQLKEAPFLKNFNVLKSILEPLETSQWNKDGVSLYTIKLLHAICDNEFCLYYILGATKHPNTVVTFEEVRHCREEAYCDASETLQGILLECLSIKLKENDSESLECQLLTVQICMKFMATCISFNTMWTAFADNIVPTVCKLYRQLLSHHDEHKLKNLRQLLLIIASCPFGPLLLLRYNDIISELLCADFTDLPPYLLHTTYALVPSVYVWSKVEDKIYADLHHISDCLLSRLVCDRYFEHKRQTFLNSVFGVASTLAATKALLEGFKESKQNMLENALYTPRTLTELLTLKNIEQPWHFISLLIIYGLSANLDIWIYLETKFGLQQKLLELQAENVNMTYNGTEQAAVSNRNKIIIDECSKLRQQILLHTSIPCGPNECCVNYCERDVNKFEEMLSEEGSETLFTFPPQYNLSFKQSAVATDLHKFLQESQADVRDNKWLIQMRKTFKASSSEVLQDSIVPNIIEEVSKFYGKELFHIDWSSQVKNELHMEEQLGIYMAVRYGIGMKILQGQQHEESLAKIMKLGIRRNMTQFQRFDWFTATVYIMSSGNTERCTAFLANVVTLPCVLVLWPSLAESFGYSKIAAAFTSLLKVTVADEIPQVYSALEMSKIPWEYVCYSWVSQCFWTILDWDQICQWLMLCALYPPEMSVYFCVSLICHMEKYILDAVAHGTIWNRIQDPPLADYRVSENICYMEKMSRHERSGVMMELVKYTKVHE